MSRYNNAHYWARVSWPDEVSTEMVFRLDDEIFCIGDGKPLNPDTVELISGPLRPPKAAWRRVSWETFRSFLVGSGVTFWIAIGFAAFTYLTWK